eukprot:scaffold2653_cov176-Ochromonas_danica.AAC.5
MGATAEREVSIAREGLAGSAQLRTIGSVATTFFEKAREARIFLVTPSNRAPLPQKSTASKRKNKTVVNFAVMAILEVDIGSTKSQTRKRANERVSYPSERNELCGAFLASDAS